MPEKMICPICGAEMNFHAEKLIYSEGAQHAGTVNGGQVEEIHTCPNCGRTDSRLLLPNA